MYYLSCIVLYCTVLYCTVLYCVLYCMYVRIYIYIKYMSLSMVKRWTLQPKEQLILND